MFKDRLKELRTKKGISQQELGDKIYVSRSAICKWESGLGVPSDANLKSLCAFFEVDEEWLFDRQDLKESLEISKKENKSFHTIIALILNLLFLFSALIRFDQTVIALQSDGDRIFAKAWNIFNGIEIIGILLIFIIGINLNLIIYLNDKDKLKLNINEVNRKKYLKCSLVVSIVNYCLFIFFFFIRSNNPKNYVEKVISDDEIIQMILATSIIIIAAMVCLFKKEKPLLIANVIGLLVMTPFFLLTIYFFIYFLKPSNQGNKGGALAIIFTMLMTFGLVSWGSLSLPYIISSRRKNKNKFNLVALILTISYIAISVILCAVEIIINKMR